MTAHFVDRCRERGLAHVADKLRDALVEALRQHKTRAPTSGALTVEHVFDLPTHGTCRTKAIYRFMVDGTQYFAVVIDGLIPVTVLTHDMLAYYRARNRKASKGSRRHVAKVNRKSKWPQI